MTKVRVEIDPNYRNVALSKGYDTEPFEAELAGSAPWVFWHRVRPLSGKHAAIIDLPPMFRVTEID